ncbi:MAG: TauD/TfdA family dioxygenase [Thalassolituus sp.]
MDTEQPIAARPQHQNETPLTTAARLVGGEHIITPEDLPADSSLWKNIVLKKTQDLGYVVLRGFDLKDAEAFQDFLENRLTVKPWNVFNKLKVAGPVITFVRRITDGILGAGDNRSYVNSQLQQLGRIDNSVQGPHIEGGVYDKRARYLFMYCEAAPQKWGETGVADMGLVFNSLSPDTRDALSQAWQQFEFTSVKQLNWLERLILTIGRIKHYERKDKFMQMLLDNIPMVCRHPETGMLCPQIWAYRGDTVYNAASETFAERTPLDRECMADTWQIGWSLKGKDGKPIENGVELMDELIKATFKHARLVSWQQGDIAVVDNIRCSHWRMNGFADQPRRVFQLQAVPYQASDLTV